MSTGQHLQAYRELERLYGEMLAAARQEAWEQVAEVGESAAKLTAELGALGPLPEGDAEHKKVHAASIERVLALIGELQALAGPARAERGERLAEGAMRARLSNAYGA